MTIEINVKIDDKAPEKIMFPDVLLHLETYNLELWITGDTAMYEMFFVSIF